MKLSAIISVLENEFPPALAEEWDNVGLLVGDTDAEITKILVSLDVTDQAVARAEEIGAELILTHHPLISGRSPGSPSRVSFPGGSGE